MIIIALPVFNEGQSIINLIEDICKAKQHFKEDCELIICDDGGKDDLDNKLKEFNKKIKIHLITNKYNRGLPETIRNLLEFCANNYSPDDTLIRMDGDNTHDPKYIFDMIDKIKEGNDVVIASRYAAKSLNNDIPFNRKLISNCASYIFRILFGIKNVKDYTCGFRAYKVSIIQKALEVFGNNFIQIKGLGFSCTLEKILKLNILGAKFTEIGFKLNYSKKYNNSKMIFSITMLGYFILIVLYYWPINGWKSKH